MKKKVFVTGFKGYVGTAFCDLFKRKYNLYGCDLNFFTKKKEFNNLVKNNFDIDISNLKTRHLQSVDTVVHLAAISNDPMGEKFKNLTNKVNLKHSIKLFNLCVKSNVRKFIFASSCSVYGASFQNQYSYEWSKKNPLTTYSQTKDLFEKFLLSQSTAVKIYILRFSTAAGVSKNFRLDLSLNNLVYLAIKKKLINVVSNGKPIRPFIDVNDMSKTFDYLIEEEKFSHNAEVLNVGIDKNNISIKNLAKLISKITKTPYSINKNSQPDKRTYRVNFDKFKKRTGTLTKNFNDLKKIIESLAKYFKSSKFKEQSRNYRLNHLKKK